MNLSLLLRANAIRYRPFYRLIALAVIIMTALVSGSLMIGDSVRHTLTNRVSERIGNTETAIFSLNSFFDEGLAQEAVFGGSARRVLISNGFISDEGRLLPVMVWGVDDKDIPPGAAKVNPRLAAELSEAATSDIVLRLPATRLVPSGSLFVTSNYTSSLRLSFAGTVPEAEGGNISLKNEQIIPSNIFLNRDELALAIETEGKLNLILSDRIISATDLAEVWTPATSGIRAATVDSLSEITSERIFLQTDLVNTIVRDNPGANRLFSYMANSLESSSGSIPYSFVTAIDRYAGLELSGNDIILSDYSAQRLGVATNDSISVSYFVSSDLKTLSEEQIRLRVAKILPLKMLLEDKTLSADFPGLSDVERCTDWDSDMPINMDRIAKEDEDYWTLYRSTPKALISYQAIAPRWANSYGSATAIRLSGPADLSGLDPAMLGLQMVYPRQMGLEAAQSGIDFGGLFLSLGIFIIFSALLLMLMPLQEMIFERRNELGLMRALGFSRRLITRILFRESVAVVLLASTLGVLAGACYTALSLALLNSLWNGAVHTSGFSFLPGWETCLIGWLAGAALALITLRIAIGRELKRVDKPPALKPLKADSMKGFNQGRLIWAGLRMDRKRAWTSFAALASGVLIVFSVGLNRRGFADSSQILSGTGGYSLWCETSVPLYHNIYTAEGRAKLALADLPSDVDVLQIFRYGADDASCLNLNKVIRPSILGIDMAALDRSSFRILQCIYDQTSSSFAALQSARGDVYPAAIDETTLLWGLQRQLGDTISYETTDGRLVSILLAASLQNSIFQGNLLMDKNLFAEIWPEIRGSEIALFRCSSAQMPALQRSLSQALSEYGARIVPASQRLKEFNSVTDTYLTIFLTLGGLGLLLGLGSFVVSVRKNLAARGPQIELYRSLGFADYRIANLLARENRIVPLAAIIGGILLSLLILGRSIINVRAGIWLTAIALMLLLLLSSLIFIRRAVERKIKNSNQQHL
ncbi:MAG: ABC transporter permease [Tannerellaceae bacterium]|jgi:putative ABC transport system permease protein|nr:ABC transporter permease [Tannerellaceae bacterium]